MSTTILFLPLLLITVCNAQTHPLDEYVARADENYDYYLLEEYDEGGYDVYILNMTSQRWMDDEFCNSSLWFHYVTVVIPKPATIHDQALLFIGIGQNWHDPPEPETDPFIPILGMMAEETGAVMSMISQVPNQPILFRDDSEQRGRREDDTIAWTWMHYLNQTEEERNTDMLLYMPMTKAVVRGMDTVAEFSHDQNPSLNIDKFVIGGPSKRGWTTYLTAAVDDRIAGIFPMVISCLNLIPNLHHHYQSLGGWSWAFVDYWREGLTAILDDPEAELIAYLQDPYTFMDRYTMPKLLVKAGNDEFFMLDDHPFYIHDFPPPTYLFLLQNTNHIMVGQWERIAETVITFFLDVHDNHEWPDIDYMMYTDEESAHIEATVSETPINVTGWYVDTREGMGRRDFRSLMLNEEGNDTIPNFPRWFPTEVDELGDNNYRLEMDKPPEGWRGFFIVFEMDAAGGRTLEFSTDAVVVPDIFPFEDCSGAECRGEIV